MPYKDPEAKREWELGHRAERLARRRELRRIKAAQPTQPKVDTDGAGVYLLMGLLPLTVPFGLRSQPQRKKHLLPHSSPGQ